MTDTIESLLAEGRTFPPPGEGSQCITQCNCVLETRSSAEAAVEA